MQHLGIPFLLKMQHEVLFFSPHFIDDTLNTRAECVRDSLICRKYMFLAKIFALKSMGIQLVPSPHLPDTQRKWGRNRDVRGHEHSQCCIQILIASDLVAIKTPYFKYKQATPTSTFCATNEPRNDITNKMSVRSAKTQISLGIRPV